MVEIRKEKNRKYSIKVKVSKFLKGNLCEQLQETTGQTNHRMNVNLNDCFDFLNLCNPETTTYSKIESN